MIKWHYNTYCVLKNIALKSVYYLCPNCSKQTQHYKITILNIISAYYKDRQHTDKEDQWSQAGTTNMDVRDTNSVYI